MSKTAALTATRLRQVLHYEPGAGVFTWLLRDNARFDKVLVGTQAGSVSKKGYRQIKIDGVLHRSGRLAWLYMTGVWPVAQVDHSNLLRDDDRWDNLRDATQPQQSANQGRRADNTSGFKGVSWAIATSRWKAQVSINGKRVYLGCFDTPEMAYAAYCAAVAKHFGQYARVA